MPTLVEWLESRGLGQYAAVFAQHDIGLDVLSELTEHDFEQLGLPLGARKRLLKAIRNQGQPSAAEAVPPPSPSPVVAPNRQGERRQLTVLFCDMVGFTELANRVDPEMLQGIIRSYEDACAVCITRYAGYVFQRLGDGIVAFFGYPLAHEGEAERAIRAGLEIIEALSKLDVPDAGHLAVRIGIATGLVVVASAEKGAVGETMNLASRLQGIAQPGSIVVSERVQRLAGGSFDYQDLGEQTLKGIARPTHAYRILGVSEAASRFEAAHDKAGLTPLVGREQEIGLLLERWALAQDGEGQVVLLSGEPGIGKSRILSALRERLEGQRAQALRFQCSPYYVNSAFWPSIDNFERALKFGRDESPESKLDKLEALIVTHYGRPLSDVRFIASILSIPCEERYGVHPMTPQKHKDETLRTLVDLTEAAARKQPSVMLYEDAHWADPTTLEVLDLLIDRVKGFPLFIVLTHRPEFQSRWAQHGHVISLNLSKLTRAQSSAMVSKVAGAKALPSDLHEQIVTKTDGVPLFVEELTKSILESGELKEAGDRYEYVGSAHSITIPATLRDSLMARLDRFMPVKEIAQIGAAIGREFSYELIQAVAPKTQAELDQALQQLTDSGLAFQKGTPPDALYTFKHALVQDAAYDSLLKSRRQELHAKIARVIEERFPKIKDIEPEVLAHHYTQASLPEQAVSNWVRAGQLTFGRVALPEAVSHLSMALSVNGLSPASVERDHRELEIRILLGAAYLAFRGWAATAVLQTFHPARDLAMRLGDDEKLVSILYYLWVSHFTRCEFPEATAAVEGLYALARMRNDSVTPLVARWVDCIYQVAQGHFQRARQVDEELFALYSDESHGHLLHLYNHDPISGPAPWRGVCLWALGYPDQARQAVVDGRERAQRVGHPFNRCWCLVGGTMPLLFRGEGGIAREWVAEAKSIAEEHGLALVVDVLVPWFDGAALVVQGEYESGYAKLANALKIWRAIEGRNLIPFANMLMAQALMGLGRFDEGAGVLHEAVELIERTGHRTHESEVRCALGELLRRQPSPQGAEASFRKALDVARVREARGSELRAATGLARLWQSQGKRREALKLLKPVYGWFTEGFDTRDLKEARALLDQLQ